jgi:hypothetical protein
MLRSRGFLASTASARCRPVASSTSGRRDARSRSAWARSRASTARSCPTTTRTGAAPLRDPDQEEYLSVTEPQRLALHRAAQRRARRGGGDTLMALTPPANTDIATRQDVEHAQALMSAQLGETKGVLQAEIAEAKGASGRISSAWATGRCAGPSARCSPGTPPSSRCSR